MGKDGKRNFNPIQDEPFRGYSQMGEGQKCHLLKKICHIPYTYIPYNDNTYIMMHIPYNDES